MEFSLSQEQRDIQELAAKILDDLAPPERLPDFETGQDWFDQISWRALADAQLLGVALPSDVGGLGMGVVELALLLEQVGSRCAPIPVLSTLMMAAPAIDTFGTPTQRTQILPAVVAGEAVLTVALHDDGSRDPSSPSTTASRDGDGWRLRGTKLHIPSLSLATRVLVPARTAPSRVGVFLVDPNAERVTRMPMTTTTGEYQYEMCLDDVHVDSTDVLGDPLEGTPIVESIVDHTLAGLCATELGVAERALRMTAAYAGERKQFGKPIATFQAVAQRAGDAYIDLEAIRLATWQAVWRLAAGLPARRELRIAKFWASEGGHRICYAAQHLHGGIGVDTDYPLHHYYLLSRLIELTLGGAHAQLAALGSALASSDAAPA